MYAACWHCKECNYNMEIKIGGRKNVLSEMWKRDT